jgi:1-deoxyxylulose-5-phosphate synthase
VPVGDTIARFEGLRAQGMIGAWGLSNYSHEQLREALEYGRPALVQNSFSLLERGDEADVLPLCAGEDIAYVPFGPLAGGWLTGKYRRGERFPAGSRMTQRPGPYERYLADEVFDALDALEREANARNVDVTTLAFAWVLARCDGAVCGPNRAAHLDPVLAAQALLLSQDDVDRIGGLFS